MRSAGCWPRTSWPSATCPPSPTARWTASPCARAPRGARCAIVGESRAGTPASVGVQEGEAIRISTGAAVPEGADAVLQVELVTLDGDTVTLDDDVAPGRNLRPAGDDVDAGETVLTAGTRIGAAEIGIAVVAGRGTVTCARKPARRGAGHRRRARPPGGPLGPGQLHNSNGATLAALATQAGALVLRTATWAIARRPRARPSPRRSRRPTCSCSPAASRSARTTTSSPRSQALGVDEVFWRVALRPGSPTWFGTRDDALVFGLPGNPVSAMVTFLLFARPALGAMQGAPHEPRADRQSPRRGHPSPPRSRRVRARDPARRLRARRPARRDRTSSARCSAPTASRS